MNRTTQALFVSVSMSAACIATTACDRGSATPASSEASAATAGAMTTSSALGAEPPTPNASAEPAAGAWSFDSAAPGTRPASFSAEEGEWEVVADASAPSGPKVLAQLAASDGPVFNVVLVESTKLADVELTVKLRSVDGQIDQGGGMIWRARDARNYYIARYNPLEDNYRLYIVEDGRRKMLETATVRLDHAAWHTLRVTMIGDRISCSLDGTKYLEATDTTFAKAGTVGLWTKADAKTHFDDFTAKAPR